MKTRVTLKDLKEFVDSLKYKKINYMVIAGFGLDGKRGYQTRPHQDLDVLCLKKDLPKIEEIVDKLGYTGERHHNLYKLHRKDGSKIDVGLLVREGTEIVSYGRIAITKFPKELFEKPQKGHIKNVEFNVAPNELLKKWGSNSQKKEDAEYAKTLPTNPKLFKKIKRKLRKSS